jgi:hypothetical protein
MCITVLLSGCASVQQLNSERVLEPKLEIGETRVHFNVAGGFWKDFRIEFDNVQGEKLELLILHRNSHKKWAPTQAICVGAKLPSNEICINVRSMTTADETQLALVKTVGNLDHSGILESVPIVGNFPVGVKIVVDLSVEKKVLHFKINNEIAVSHRLDFEPEMLRLGCSSVECVFLSRN